MENLGMLSLGAFAGGVLCLGLPLNPENFKIDELMKITLFVVSTAITGPIFTWIGKLGGATTLGDALFSYPIGLLLALLWFYVRISLLNFSTGNVKLIVLSALHILIVMAATLVAAYVFVLPVLKGI